jgi:hypothetical protein
MRAHWCAPSASASVAPECFDWRISGVRSGGGAGYGQGQQTRQQTADSTPAMGNIAPPNQQAQWQ